MKVSIYLATFSLFENQHSIRNRSACCMYVCVCVCVVCVCVCAPQKEHSILTLFLLLPIRLIRLHSNSSWHRIANRTKQQDREQRKINEGREGGTFVGGASRKEPYAFSKNIPACLHSLTSERRVERETRAGASAKKERLADSTLISLNVRVFAVTTWEQ